MQEWRYSFIHSRNYMEVNGHFHDPAALPRWDVVDGTHWIGIRVGHSPIEHCGGEKNISPCRESNHNSSISQPIAKSLYPLRYLGSSLGEQKFLYLYVTFMVRRL
jgi:hypothetical protein